MKTLQLISQQLLNEFERIKLWIKRYFQTPTENRHRMERTEA